MIKALLFDLDGLIIDTESAEFQAWSEIYREYNCELDFNTWADCIGRPDGHFDPHANLEKLANTLLDRETIRDKRRNRSWEIVEGTNIQPGIKEYILEAKSMNLKLAVVSSSSHRWVDKVLTKVELLEYFDLLICREDTEIHKPNPEPYLKALSLLNCKSNEAIAFEDSLNGVNSAVSAKIFCVNVPNPLTKHLIISNSNIRLNSLSDISLKELIEIASK